VAPLHVTVWLNPDARLYRKSNNAEARLAYLGHLLMSLNGPYFTSRCKADAHRHVVHVFIP
jgi:hypothetical protein